MYDRRRFIKTASATVGAAMFVPEKPVTGQTAKAAYFKVHPAVENDPEAVFIMKTAIVSKLDSEGKRAAGLAFARSVFIPSPTPGIPITHTIPVKTNTILGKARPPYGEDYYMGAHTDPLFVEGVIEGMKELGIPGKRFFLRDVSCDAKVLEESGYAGMAERVGGNLLETADVKLNPAADVTWVNVPDGLIHRRIPYLRPYNAPDTFLVNIAKFKSHAMGLTLSCKNVQGMIARPYQGFCGGLAGVGSNCAEENLRPGYRETVEKNWRRHMKAGVPRWDKPGEFFDCGLGMETWATRTLDNLSATRMGLCVIEALYGRDGSHWEGPHPPFENGNPARGRAHDFPTNMVIFGKNPVHVDIVGFWLGGHEPGNIGLFHLARERGMTTKLDPKTIPLYRWEHGAAVQAKLDDFERTPLLTYYLRRNYDGRDEPVYHLCDEPYDYKG